MPRAKAKKQEAASESFSADFLRRILRYDEATGIFTWRVTRGQLARCGNRAGYHVRLGYRCITLCGRPHREHRLAWFYVHGRWPDEQLDHINGIRDDNRISNLRECTREENYQNKAKYRNNTTGFTGVVWHHPNKRWVARISRNGKKICLGYFDRAEDAHAAYLAAKRIFHPFQPYPREAA